MLAVIETHPVQYHAPVYREVARQGVPVTAIYGSDFSVRASGYQDGEFGARVQWDTDLLSGYSAQFLSRATDGGATDLTGVNTKGLREALRRTAPAAVMILGYSPRFHRVAWREALRAACPVLFRGEVMDDRVPRPRWFDAVKTRFLRSMYARSGAMLYIGDRARQHFRRLGVPESRMHFSPYCVDTRPMAVDEGARLDLRLQIRRSLGLDPEQFVVLYAGKLSARKGVDLILPAVARMAPTSSGGMAVVFMGDGGLRVELERDAADRPEVEVRFAGFQPQRCLSGFYHAADALVLPSRHSETWGLVVNEALHHGVPCVVSDSVGCAPDLIVEGGTGCVSPTGSTEGLADALRSLVRLGRYDRERREACRRHVAGYGVEAAARGIVSAYAGVTTERCA